MNMVVVFSILSSFVFSFSGDEKLRPWVSFGDVGLSSVALSFPVHPLKYRS